MTELAPNAGMSKKGECVVSIHWDVVCLVAGLDWLVGTVLVKKLPSYGVLDVCQQAWDEIGPLLHDVFEKVCDLLLKIIDFLLEVVLMPLLVAPAGVLILVWQSLVFIVGRVAVLLRSNT